MRNLLLALLASSLFATTPLYELETELETEMESEMDFEELYYELLEKYKELLEKYEAIAGTDQEEEAEPLRLASGTFIVGESFPAGSYDFEVTDGVGTAYLFRSYDDYLEDEFNYMSSFDLIAPEVKENAADALKIVYNTFTTEISLTVRDEMCVVLVDVTLQEKAD